MLDNAENDAPEFDPPDAERVYRNYLRTCEMLGIEPVPRDRAQGLSGLPGEPIVSAVLNSNIQGLIQEWGEALSGRPQPTTH